MNIEKIILETNVLKRKFGNNVWKNNNTNHEYYANSNHI